MNDVYRVVCSENPRLYPGKTFIDIYPAGSSRPENCLNHDCILMMRQVINPEVYSLESGILLHTTRYTSFIIFFLVQALPVELHNSNQ